ncbi:hypothetical protein HYX70_00630 [Candidatus Saccharibacteria bacterium]|nr:hypothetical protein [Candidatus Saccharibacteria bacterium]
MIQAVLSLGYVVIVVLVVLYLVYMVGLSRVLGQLQARGWRAFVPIYNYYYLIKTLNLPKRWFFMALIPYAGSIYSFAVASRLGRVYRHNFIFSWFWLTFGAPVGMHIISLSKKGPNLEALKEQPPNLRQVEQELIKLRKHNRVENI